MNVINVRLRLAFIYPVTSSSLQTYIKLSYDYTILVQFVKNTLSILRVQITTFLFFLVQVLNYHFSRTQILILSLISFTRTCCIMSDNVNPGENLN